MRKYLFAVFSLLFILSLLSSCRPPELEGAYVDFNAGRFDNALENAEKATRMYPKNPEAWYMLGRLYGKKDNYKGMMEAFEKSLAISKQFENQIKNEKMLYFQNSFNSGVTNFNKFTKLEDTESEQAVKLLNTALENFKNAKLINNDYQSSSLIARTYNLLKQKENALAEYQELTKNYPDSSMAWLAIGKVHFFDKDYKNAVTYLARAQELDPTNLETISFLSQSYDKLEDTENAIAAYEQAIALNKTEVAFPFNLGLIYNRLANKEGIEEDLKNEYLNKVVENFDLVIQIDPQQKSGWEMKSIALIQLKRNDDAVSTIKSALERFPNEGSFWFNLGVAYTNGGKAKVGKEAFKKAEELGYK